MEVITLSEDIKIIYVTAVSFPDGIMKAHDKLRSIIPYDSSRNYYGISRPENDRGIIYKAGTEETLKGEAEKYKLDTMILLSGNYKFIDVSNYQKDISQIEKAFQIILEESDIDPQGYCVEHYQNDQTTVRCMVRII